MIKLLIAFIPLLIVLGGTWMITRTIRATRLDEKERKELDALRKVTDDLLWQAADHIALGDSTFAPIVHDELRNARRKGISE